MPEREPIAQPEEFTQNDGERVKWPRLIPAWELPRLEFQRESARIKAYLALHLYDKRRERNMLPPSLRQVGKYIGTETSTGATRFVLMRLASVGYLTEYQSGSGSSVYMIAVNLETVEKPKSIELPEIEGLTYPKPKAPRHQP